MQRKIKNMLERRSDSFGDILNLSKHSFSLNTYKLLNKILNFVPTRKQYSQKQLYTDTRNIFRLLKLRALFKSVNVTKMSDQLYQPFKVKTKRKWTPKHITWLKLLKIKCNMTKQNKNKKDRIS